MEDDDLVDDPLFLACTRPAMLAGVNLEAMVLNVMVTMSSFVLFGSFVCLGLGVVVHLIFRQIVRYDHNAFRTLFVWFDTAGRSKNTALWGGSSVTPLRLGRQYNTKDLNDG